ncbi:O-antigen ligase family protein [Neptunicella marina]|uniref:O-antigen ligase family protein n=1 Tax=Neptunicella marina TaxID=2125989 RepID=A0A8J6M821_9ALTE|nr:O-antigen ligase family protein [Neptunicella marina]MBC3767646.1 O-antigen ligase family protein [Neptunicella marina]
MQISIERIKRLYLLLALLYYLGFVNFINQLISSNHQGDEFAQNVAGSGLKQVVGIVLLAMGLYLIARLPIKQIWQGIKHNALWILLVAYFALSVSWSPVPAISFRRVIAFVTLLVVAYCLVELFEPVSLLKLVARTIAVAAALGLLYFIISPENASIRQSDIRANAFLGIMADKNTGARLYAYALLIMWGLKLYQRKWDIAACLVLLVCILLAQSATAVVMTTAGIGVITLLRLLRSPRPQHNLNRILLFCLLLAGGSLLISYFYEDLLALLGRDPTLTNRVIIWQLMDTYVAQHQWLGYGFGAFWASDAVDGFVDSWGYIGNAHSGYYEALLNGGMVCLIIVCLLFIKTLADLVKRYISRPDGHFYAVLIPIILLQVVVNYVAFIIINHNCYDMFIFALVSFMGCYPAAQYQLQPRPHVGHFNRALQLTCGQPHE